MKTAGKYYVQNVISRKTVQDSKTHKETCYVCPKGHNCPHAHNPIELDLIPISSNIKNLNSIIKV
jgi:hypothetical protein